MPDTPAETAAPTVAVEVVAAERVTTEITTQLAAAFPESAKLPGGLLANIETGFRDAFALVRTIEEEARNLRVTSIDQKAEMKRARELRLQLKAARVTAEKTRKDLKSDALLMGRAIDGANNLFLAACEPLERHLQEQEEYAERVKAEERAKRIADRRELMAPYAGLLPPMSETLLGDMSDADFEATLENAKLLERAKAEEAARVERERIERERIAAEEAAAKAAAEAAERERLQREAEEARAAAEAERKAREEAEAAAKAAAEQAAREKAEAEEAARKEREALEAAARAEREKAEAARREAERKAAAERARLQAEAEAARKAAADAAAKVAAEQAAREEAERQRLAAEEAARKAAEAAAKKAAQAPDREKLTGFASEVRKLTVPEAKTEAGRKVAAEVAAKVEAFAKWIETQAAAL